MLAEKYGYALKEEDEEEEECLVSLPFSRAALISMGVGGNLHAKK